MRILIDARWIFPRISGVGAHTLELIRQLAQLDRRNEYVLLFDDPRQLDIVARRTGLAAAPNFSTNLVSFGIFSPRNQLLLPPLLKKLRIDVFHSPNYMIPLFAFPRHRPGAIRCVTTIHDLIPLLFPHFAPRARKARLFPIYRSLMREIVARADIILTVSESSRADIIREFGLGGRSETVLVAPNGVAEEYVPGERTGSAGKLLLYVGRFDPYKNVEGMLRAFARARELYGKDLRLRIIGAPDPRYPEGPRLACELGVDKAIEWIGYADGNQLIRAYREADVLLLLSKYEGFGLTVLEAMACGTPVVCSNAASLPEVAGNAAILVEPEDVEGAASGIVRLLTDSAFANRMREQGIKQAASFTWRRTAQLTIAAYENAVNRT